MTRLLFVCSGNVFRSPTAEELFNGRDGVEARSAGILGCAVTSLSKMLIDWADKIFVMEPHHKMRVVELVPGAERKTRTLNIPDIYPKNDPELQRVLKRKVERFLN